MCQYCLVFYADEKPLYAQSALLCMTRQSSTKQKLSERVSYGLAIISCTEIQIKHVKLRTCIQTIAAKEYRYNIVNNVTVMHQLCNKIHAENSVWITQVSSITQHKVKQMKQNTEAVSSVMTTDDNKTFINLMRGIQKLLKF